MYKAPGYNDPCDQRTLKRGSIMWCHAMLATALMTLAVTPACAAKITVMDAW
jgi:hypothetical protein